jgi:hypothetical protein
VSLWVISGRFAASQRCPLYPERDCNSDRADGLEVPGTTCKHGLVKVSGTFAAHAKGAFNLFRRIAAGPTISIRQSVTPWDDWISSAISTAAK